VIVGTPSSGRPVHCHPRLSGGPYNRAACQLEPVRQVELTSRQFGTVVVVTPVGRVDHASSGALEAALAPLWANAEVSALLLDFTGVPYISSVGLRVLMIAAKQVRARRARIGIAALQPVVAEIFSISRFDKVLEVFPTLRDALVAVSPQALAAYDAA
jgi:anti-sigma B factor antagonist